MKTDIHFLSYLAQFFLECEMFQTKFGEEIKTQMLSWVTFFPPENRAVYEIMWENVVERGRPQMTIWHISVASRITMATNTVIVIAFPLQ